MTAQHFPLVLVLAHSLSHSSAILARARFTVLVSAWRAYGPVDAHLIVALNAPNRVNHPIHVFNFTTS